MKLKLNSRSETFGSISGCVETFDPCSTLPLPSPAAASTGSRPWPQNLHVHLIYGRNSTVHPIPRSMPRRRRCVHATCLCARVWRRPLACRRHVTRRPRPLTSTCTPLPALLPSAAARPILRCRPFLRCPLPLRASAARSNYIILRAIPRAPRAFSTWRNDLREHMLRNYLNPRDFQKLRHANPRLRASPDIHRYVSFSFFPRLC